MLRFCALGVVASVGSAQGQPDPSCDSFAYAFIPVEAAHSADAEGDLLIVGRNFASDDPLAAFDVSDLSSVVALDELVGTSGAALNLQIVGDHVYFPGSGPLVSVDVSDPSSLGSPQTFSPTSGLCGYQSPFSYSVADGIGMVGADRSGICARGFETFEITSPGVVSNISNLEITPGLTPYGVFAGGGLGYSTARAGTNSYVVSVYDFMTPGFPKVDAITYTGPGVVGLPFLVRPVGNTVYVGEFDSGSSGTSDGLVILDASDVSDLMVHDRLDFGYSLTDLEVVGSVGWFAAGSGGQVSRPAALLAVDLSDPFNPTLINEVFTGAGGGRSFSLDIDGDRVYFVEQFLGVHVFDFSVCPSGDCPADVNGDGLATPADFNAWILAFNSNAPECDQNNDGLCNPSDFNAWILNFNQGCS